MRRVRRTLFPVRQRQWFRLAAWQSGAPSATGGQSDHDVRRDPRLRRPALASDMGGMTVSTAVIPTHATSGTSQRHRGENAAIVCGIRAWAGDWQAKPPAPPTPYKVLSGGLFFSRKNRNSRSELRSDAQGGALCHRAEGVGERLQDEFHVFGGGTVAHGADAEHLAGQRSKAAGDLHAVFLQQKLTDLGIVHAR